MYNAHSLRSILGEAGFRDIEQYAMFHRSCLDVGRIVTAQILFLSKESNKRPGVTTWRMRS